MSCFTVENIEQLREFLWRSNIHDGMFIQSKYNQFSKTFTVHIENRVWNDTLNMVFSGIQKIFTVSDDVWGTNETIGCLVEIGSEKNLPFEINDSDKKNHLCFVWEMLSGNQIYIVCKMLEVHNGSVDP